MLTGSIAEIDLVLGRQRPWRRLLDAVGRGSALRDHAAHSIGDAAGYRLLAEAEADEHFAAHQRYHDAYLVLDGYVSLEVASRVDLTVVRPYSDLDDTELLRGSGTIVEVETGTMAVLPLAEAARVRALSGRVVKARVTVEGFFLV